jgi:hypothetical protein
MQADYLPYGRFIYKTSGYNEIIDYFWTGMKLNKRDLIKALRPGFEAMGYHYFKDSISGAQGLFGKKIAKDLYLQAALTIHRFYDDQFTVDLCFTNTTCIYHSGLDIPDCSDIRPCQLLSVEERIKYYHCDKNDCWWSLYGSEDIRSVVVEVLSIVEPRLVNNSDLLRRIRESIHLQTEELLEKWIIDNYTQKLFLSNLKYTPDRPLDDIPLDWFRASETILLFLFNETAFPKVRCLASDSFRRYTLDSMFGE